MPLIPAGDRDHEAQVGVDHALLRGLVAALDPLRQRDLFGCGQQRVLPNIVHELRDGVDARGRFRLEVQVELVILGRCRCGDLDAAGVQLGTDQGKAVVAEVELCDELLDGGDFNGALVLGVLEKRGQVVCMKCVADESLLQTVVAGRAEPVRAAA